MIFMNATSATKAGAPRTQIDAQRMAWGILLISFAIFCVVCVTVGVALYYFLFESMVPLNASVQVGRGSAGVSDQIVRRERTLTTGDVISTDLQSQATVFLYDPQQDDRLVATLTVYGDTSLVLRRALRPRFDWSSAPYTLDVRDLVGELEVVAAAGGQRSFRLAASTLQGHWIDVSAGGTYIIRSLPTETSVANYGGQAVIIPADQTSGRDVPVGFVGLIRADYPDRVDIVSSAVNLLGNSRVQDVTQSPTQGMTAAAGPQWVCSNTQVNLPQGSFQTEFRSGRSVLRLVRGEGATANGETRCLVYFGQGGWDVSGYDFLELRVTFNLQYQSLNACGILGSECPLMLRMDYIDQNGKEQIWYHGFFYLLDPQLNYPMSCSSCRQEHEVINEKAWYTYDSGNLFVLLGPDQIPRQIVNVQFYASGHQYDVLVSDFGLYARQPNGASAAFKAPGPS